MSNLLNKIVQAGVTDKMPIWLKQKIILSNTIALSFGGLIGTPFIFTTYHFFPQLTYLPLIGVLFCIISLLLAKARFQLLARITINLVPNILVFVYMVMLVSAGDDIPISIVALQAVFSLIPFVIFDQREWPAIALTCMLTLASIVFAYDATGWANLNLNDAPAREGWLYYLILVVAVLAAYTLMQALALNSHRADVTAVRMLKEGRQKQEALQHSEEELKNYIQQVEENQKEEERRIWASDNLAAFSQILRKAETLDQMCNQVLFKLVKALNGTQGSLYLIQEGQGGQQTLQRVAAYAYDRSRYANKEIKPGHGPVGQAWQEADFVYLTEIPKDYIQINSGLGTHAPTQILAVPMVINDSIAGVIEIASFKPLHTYQREFIQKLGETLAGTINTTRINERTRDLLKDSQEAAEQLKQQQEEMRQNMEELAATQEEMSRKEKEYIRRIEELEHQLHDLENPGYRMAANM